MRRFGMILLVTGFLWIAYDTAFGFVEDQYVSWIWHSQNMPEGDTLTRSQVSGAMRELSLELKDRHRILLLPALMMLAGGFIALVGSKRLEAKNGHEAPNSNTANQESP